MTPRLGCCGTPARPVSLAGLVARADAHPASSRQGRIARARLGYTIAAGKAAQAGNRYAYDRAMSGLRGADLADGPGLTMHGTIPPAEAPAVRGDLERLIRAGGDAGLATAFSQVQTIGSILTGLASIGVNIGSIAGGNANDISVARMIISWINALLVGSTPVIPTLDANTLAGFVGFCRIKEPVALVLSSVFIAASALASATNNGAAASTIDQLRAWVENFLNGICNIPQIAAAAAAAASETTAAAARDAQAAACAAKPNFVLGPDGATCVCAPGFVQTRGSTGEALCTSAPATGGVPITLSLAQRRAITNLRYGRTLTPAQQALVRTVPITLTPGTLDPVTLCAPGERGNPCNGNCDGGDYRTRTACVNGVPSAPPGNKAVWALPALALAWYFFK